MNKHLIAALCAVMFCGGLLSCGNLQDYHEESAEEIGEIPQSPAVSPQIEEEGESIRGEWYATILDEYAALELKFRSLTDNEVRNLRDELGSLNVSGSMTVFDDKYVNNSIFVGLCDSNLSNLNDNFHPIVYALHDINGDGTPELLLGVDHGYMINRIRIYALQSSNPAFVLQAGWHEALNLQLDDSGRVTILRSWGRMDYHELYFYAIDENGELILLDILNEHRITSDPFTLGYRKDVNSEMIDITEAEYYHLFQKHFATELESFEWEPVLKHERDN